VVYDLLPLKLPQYADNGVPEGYLKWLRVVLKSDGAICISEAVANELTEWMEQNSHKASSSFDISWFHLGADPEIPPAGNISVKDIDLVVLEKIAQKTTFLSVGTLEPRKGHRQILHAFSELWASGLDLNLVFIGKAGWKIEALSKEILEHPEYQKRLFWLNGVSDQFLEEVYKKSACLIAASEGEGFGLPLIEAAQHKKPIIARNLPVFQEVAGSGAFYFDGLDSENLAHAVESWLTISGEGRSPDSAIIPWLRWQESAQQLLSALNINKV
jgi:glycosyltransferase involved in cell wall biosynthesis